MNWAARRLSGRVHYAWISVGVVFLVLLAAAGTRATPSVMMLPLEQQFGWSRATISSAQSVNLVLYGLIGPFAAAVIDRFGVRRTMASALTVVALGVAATTQITQAWQLVLLWGVVVGGGTGMTALVLGAMVANRWFAERRGLVMGVLTASTATGQLVFLPQMASLVETYGWRIAVLAIAGFGACVAPLVGWLMRDRPSDVGLQPYGASAPEPAPAPAGNPFVVPLEALWRGMHSRDFWLLFMSFFICGASTNGLIGTHLIAACFDHGIPVESAAWLLAAMGVFDFFGTTLSGWLSDRWSNRWLLFWYYGLRGLSLIYLPYALDISFFGLSLFAVFYGLDWIATVPPTVRLTANIFGKQQVGMMFGWIVAGHQLGAGFASLGAGVLRTELGSYLEAFMISGSLCLVAAVMVLRIGMRKPDTRTPLETAPAAG